ncbi:oligosaccharide flippase family protein [Clostridium novyi]|uniref:Membrane protein involved in the export of O-antigen and teichoic acid, RfbX family, putative n=3 Tax=Clostridium novyi TaxID=1542 RepID=A0PZ13_CLONN|nr:oligosaccharide flippase family protein [Clostridium novyi]ABK61510.1 membrane protein involved in the export of O-antigen and teichoic acid, RfbX family, putative [Clostridium novyi NT]
MKRYHNYMSIGIVYLSKVINAILSFLITYMATKNICDTDLFGKYSYVISISAYISLFIGFGFNDALMNLIVNSDDNYKNKNLCGLGYLTNIIFSVVYCIIFYVFAAYNKELKINFLLILFSHAIIINDLLNRIVTALKRVKILVLNNFLINITICILYILFKTTYINYLIIYFLCYFIYTNIIYFYYLKPNFKEIKSYMTLLIDKVKEYGFHVYLGRVSSMGVYDLDKIMIKVYSQVKYVGFYNLGLSCINPITMFADSIMSVLFRDIAKKNKLDKKIIYGNIVWLVGVGILFISIGKYIFMLMFGLKYKYISDNFIWFAVLAFFRGFFIPYNNFLAVKGFGKYLRNTAFILTIFNIVFNFLFIPRYKMIGAIWATILSLVVDDIAHVYYYKKAVDELESSKEVATLKE